MGLNRTSGGILACAAVVLAGCQTGVPQAQDFPTKSQLVLNSAGQWQVLAGWTIGQLAPALPADRRIAVRAPNDSAFAKGFAELLATELVKRGYVVVKDDGAAVLHFDDEVVEHGHIPPPAPLAFTFLGALGGVGAWVLDTNGVQPAFAVASGLAVGPAIDLKRGYFPAPSNTEVSVTTSISRSGLRYASRSDVFYIAKSDKGDYQGSDPTIESASLTGDFP